MNTALFVVRFMVLLTPLSCKPTATESLTADAVVRGPAGSMDFSVSSSGVMKLIPGEGESITKVDSVAASTVAVQNPITPSTTPVAIGTIRLGKIAYEINKKASCTRDFLTEMLPACKSPDSPDNSEVSTAAPVLTQVATPLADMVCAAHGGYQKKIWQKQFRVALSGPEKDLSDIKEVKYTVWHSYGKTYTGSSVANKFDAGSVFLTPVTSWDIDAATAVGNDGKEHRIPKATLKWSDNTPDKKAGTPCE